jgi:hypothetical protein
MEEVQGSRHFQISKAIFTDMKGAPGRLDVADTSLRMGQTSIEAPAVVSQPVKLSLPLGIARRPDHP